MPPGDAKLSLRPVARLMPLYEPPRGSGDKAIPEPMRLTNRLMALSDVEWAACEREKLAEGMPALQLPRPGGRRTRSRKWRSTLWALVAARWRDNLPLALEDAADGRE